MRHTFGEIPDSIRFKPYMPLFSNTWTIYKEMGWEDFHQFNLESQDGCYDFFRIRFNESISTSKDVITGRLKEPEKILSYIITLPNVAIRADLLQGTQRLLAGDSIDVTYIVLQHDTQEVFALLNGHLEAGLPVDWWFVHPDDEVLNRRHRKLGYKLKEIPKRLKNLRKSSDRLIEIFKDIRNERTPEWATADYMVVSAYETFALNLLYEPSSYENIVQGFDGWAAKEMYGLPDYAFALIPWPTMLNMFLFRGRDFFCKNVAGLTTESNLYISPFEEENIKYVKEHLHDLFHWYQTEKIDKGVPYPIQTLECKFPNMKNKKDPDNRFKFQYPSEERIKPSDLELTDEEFLKGVYLSVNHETPVDEKIGHSHIISTGIGKNTKYYEPTVTIKRTRGLSNIFQSRDELFENLPAEERSIMMKITSKIHVTQIIQLFQQNKASVEAFFRNYGLSKEEAEQFIKIARNLKESIDSTRNYFMK